MHCRFWHGDGTDSVGGYFTAVSQLLCRCGTAVCVCDDVFCPRNHGVKMYGRPAGHCTFTMLMVIFTGIMVYGILGFILGPLSYCMMKALIRYFASVLENAGERGTLEAI